MQKTVEIGKGYFRIHTRDCAYMTQRPRGLFTAIGKLVDSHMLTEEEVKRYWENRHWFEAHLPVPPFYGDGNSVKAITWYKQNAQGLAMFHRMDFYLAMAEKYELPLFITQTDRSPGPIVYEDEYQIGVINSEHSGDGFRTSEYGRGMS